MSMKNVAKSLTRALLKVTNQCWTIYICDDRIFDELEKAEEYARQLAGLRCEEVAIELMKIPTGLTKELVKMYSFPMPCYTEEELTEPIQADSDPIEASDSTGADPVEADPVQEVSTIAEPALA